MHMVIRVVVKSPTTETAMDKATEALERLTR